MVRLEVWMAVIGARLMGWLSADYSWAYDFCVLHELTRCFTKLTFCYANLLAVLRQLGALL